MAGTILHAARKAKNYTQSDVAEKAHISRAGYSNIEKGKRQPSVKAAKRIAAVLDIEWTECFI